MIQAHYRTEKVAVRFLDPTFYTILHISSRAVGPFLMLLCWICQLYYVVIDLSWVRGFQSSNLNIQDRMEEDSVGEWVLSLLLDLSGWDHVTLSLSIFGHHLATWFRTITLFASHVVRTYSVYGGRMTGIVRKCLACRASLFARWSASLKNKCAKIWRIVLALVRSPSALSFHL